MKRVIVLFKTHLDMGFTDMSEKVLQNYMEIYIPRAIRIAEELQKRPEGYVWTTGSFLIHRYLKTASPEAVESMEQAVRKKWIRYHGLPFTTHTELMDGPLFEYGLSLAQELDTHFGLHTIAAKMTDVPGHTKAMIPYLQKAGITMLHLGVNPASTPPQVPEVFQWLGPEQSRVIVMYSKNGYGSAMQIPYTNTYVYFAHTGDNQGPQSADEVISLYERLHEEYPDALIRAGDLNDVAKVVMTISDRLPVVTDEIGDTWIHGGASDPQKLGQYRSLLRMARHLEEPERRCMYEFLLMVPEHTWGLDTKLYLHDYEHYDKEAFSRVRTEDRYRRMEASWEEQRNYVRDAIGALGRPLCFEAENDVGQYRIAYPDLHELADENVSSFTMKGWTLQIGGQGAVVHLENEGVCYADELHRLGVFRYEVFSEREIREYQARYLVSQEDWAYKDFGKPGLDGAIDHYRSYGVRCGRIRRDEEHIYVELLPETEAALCYGCPPRLLMVLTPKFDQIQFDLAWFEKPALRIPEALWLGFCLPEGIDGIEKLGYYIDPAKVVKGGNQELHATQGGLRFGSYHLETLDAPVVSIGRQSIYGFRSEKPQTEHGIWVNLMNNAWGTNFPMWNEGDCRFRFILKKKE